MQAKGNNHNGLKIFGGFIVAILLFLVVFFLIDYFHYLNDPSPYRTLFIPRMELSLFEVTELSADRTDMVAHVLIHNPLPFNLQADNLQYKVYIGGVEVVKSSYAKSLNIKHWDSTWIELPVTTYTDKLMTVLKRAENEGKDSIIYEVKTSFGTKIIFHKDFNLDIKKLLPLIYIPTATLTEIQYDSLNFEGVTLFLNARVVNKNKFPLEFKDLKFKFMLADNPWVEGSKPGIINIPDTSVTMLVLPLRISFKEIGKSILPLIKHGRNTPYKLQATLQLVSNSNAMKNSKVIFNDAGTIKEIVELAKEEKQKEKEKKEKAKEEGRPLPAKEKYKVKFEKKN